MRQIQVCAWLLMMSAVGLAACSGDKFSPSESTGASDGASPANAGGSASLESTAGSSGMGKSPSSAGQSQSGAAADAPSSGSGGAASGAGAAPSVPISAGSSGSSPVSDCGLGKVKFKMVPSGSLAHDYLCDAACGTGWLTITDAEGATAYSLFSSCGTASCETCEVQSCVASACQAKPLTGEGSELSWDGSYFTKDTCGANMACQKPACVKPGRYKAKACAALNNGSGANGSCLPKEQVLCAEAEVELPATTTVELVLQQ